MSKPHWDPKLKADRAAFMALLAPLAYAARCRDFDEPKTPVERREVQMRLTTWMQPFVKVPRQITAEAFGNILERGVGFMPRSDEVKRECAELVAKRRRIAEREGARFQDECTVCDHTGWETLPGEPGEQPKAKRCECWTRAQKLLAQAPEAIERPMLTGAALEPQEV